MEQANPNSQFTTSQDLGFDLAAQLAENSTSQSEIQSQPAVQESLSQPDGSVTSQVVLPETSNHIESVSNSNEELNNNSTVENVVPGLDFLPLLAQIDQIRNQTAAEQQRNSTEVVIPQETITPIQPQQQQPIKPRKYQKRALEEHDSDPALAKIAPAGKVRALRTTQAEMAKVERALTEEQFLQQKDPSAERAARKTIKMKRAAERAELRAQMEAIQQNRYRPVYYYQPPTQIAIQDATAEATTFNGRFRKIIPKDPGLFQQQL